MDEILGMLKTSPPALGVARVLAPGEVELQKEALNRQLGIPLPAEVVAQLATLGAQVGLPFSASGKA
jgi:LDH2 family malate/lactate/ureidoglycolate dehydrogenase